MLVQVRRPVRCHKHGHLQSVHCGAVMAAVQLPWLAAHQFVAGCANFDYIPVGVLIHKSDLVIGVIQVCKRDHIRLSVFDSVTRGQHIEVTLTKPPLPSTLTVMVRVVDIGRFRYEWSRPVARHVGTHHAYLDYRSIVLH